VTRCVATHREKFGEKAFQDPLAPSKLYATTTPEIDYVSLAARAKAYAQVGPPLGWQSPPRRIDAVATRHRAPAPPAPHSHRRRAPELVSRLHVCVCFPGEARGGEDGGPARAGQAGQAGDESLWLTHYSFGLTDIPPPNLSAPSSGLAKPYGVASSDRVRLRFAWCSQEFAPAVAAQEAAQQQQAAAKHAAKQRAAAAAQPAAAGAPAAAPVTVAGWTVRGGQGLG
jgi:hypothetical protein